MNKVLTSSFQTWLLGESSCSPMPQSQCMASVKYQLKTCRLSIARNKVSIISSTCWCSSGKSVFCFMSHFSGQAHFYPVECVWWGIENFIALDVHSQRQESIGIQGCALLDWPCSCFHVVLYFSPTFLINSFAFHSKLKFEDVCRRMTWIGKDTFKHTWEISSVACPRWLFL